MFRRHKTKIFYLNRESGAFSLALATTLLVTSTMGIFYLLDASTLTRKNTANSRKQDLSKSTLVAASLLAKSLISRDVQDTTVGWTTDILITTSGRRANLPAIYPSPYVGGSSVGSAAIPPTTFDRRDSSNIPSSDRWSVSSNNNFNVVRVYTNDMSTVTGSNIAAIHAAPSLGTSVTTGSDILGSTLSTLTYSLRNCTSAGVNSASYTGRYCVSANIVSGANKGLIELGILQVPPDPICDSVSGSRSGSSINVTIGASGVVTGYVINVSTGTSATTIESLDSGNPKYLAWNSATAGPVSSIIPVTISTAHQRCIIGDRVKVSVTLKSVIGDDVHCDDSSDVTFTKPNGNCIATGQ